MADIAAAPDRWNEAYDAFQAVRALRFSGREEPGDTAGQLLLDVAETVAKLTYNASGPRAPFDDHAGWRLLVNLRDFLAVAHPADELEDRVRLAILNVP